MASSPRRPAFYATVLLSGFFLGGFLSSLLAHFLPESPTRTFFTWAVTPSLGPVQVDLLVVSFTIGIAINVSLMSLIGVVIAYYVARSLF